MPQPVCIILTPEPPSVDSTGTMKMNHPIEIDSSAQFRSLLEPPRLLPGECQTHVTIR
jgi:hypothetical protein